MWPWEHLVVGYLCFTVLSHLGGARAPSDSDAILVAIGSVLPDLIDKPLAWEYGLLASGYGPGHSVFVALPVALAAIVIGRVRWQAWGGVALGSGYASHIVGDVLDAWLRNGVWLPELALWPVRQTAPVGTTAGFLPQAVTFLEAYHGELLAGDPGGYPLLLVGVGLLAIGVWVLDGVPGLRWIGRLLHPRGAVTEEGR